MVLYSKIIWSRNATSVWKKIDQKELYCTVIEQEIKEKDWLNVCGNELLDIFNLNDNPTTTQFIQLTHVADGDGRIGFTGLCEKNVYPQKKLPQKRNLKERCRMSRIRDNVSSLLRP